MTETAVGFDVRMAVFEDLPYICIIEESAFPENIRYSSEELRGEIELGHCIVAETADGLIAGYASRNVRGWVGMIDSVGVLPAMQGQGIGSELVEQCKRDLSAADCVELNCDVHLHKFYRSLGFEKCGVHTTGIGKKQEMRYRMRWVP